MQCHLLTFFGLSKATSFQPVAQFIDVYRITGYIHFADGHLIREGKTTSYIQYLVLTSISCIHFVNVLGRDPAARYRVVWNGKLFGIQKVRLFEADFDLSELSRQII
jgi:hypothetical protein